MSDRIIYIICHDDTSEQIAHRDFDRYSWARVYRIPIERQCYLMESVMYSTELMSVYDEWKDKKYVGTLSYKLSERFKAGCRSYPNTIEDYDKVIRHANYNIHRVVAFMTYYTAYVEALPGLRQILNDTCQIVGIKLEDYKPKLFKFMNNIQRKNSMLDTKSFIFHNYWMTTPSIMLDYINFFTNVWLPILETHPDIWKDSSYVASVSYYRPISVKENMLKLTRGRTDYLPFHPFANERLPRLFFLKQRILVWFADDSSLILKYLC